MFFPNSAHLDACKSLNILVVGDVMLDHYLRGAVERTSPEAPVPVLRVESEDYILGGAANVAHNLAAMGAKAELACVCGRDSAAKILYKRLREAGISAKGVVEDAARPTTLKTRALAQGQQMLRIDWERSQPIANETEARLLEKILGLLDEVQGVIVSDYGKGVLTPRVLDELSRECSRRGLKILADPKGLDYSRYRGISILTPNVKEAQAAAGLEVRDEASLRKAADRLNRQVKGLAICVTRGSQGVSVFPRRGEPLHISAIPREVFDVTGAGDTFISHLALGLFQGLGLFEAASWANLAAGIVVERLGVAVVKPAELISEAGGDRAFAKVRSLAELESAVRALRASGKKNRFHQWMFRFAACWAPAPDRGRAAVGRLPDCGDQFGFIGSQGQGAAAPAAARARARLAAGLAPRRGFRYDISGNHAGPFASPDQTRHPCQGRQSRTGGNSRARDCRKLWRRSASVARLWRAFDQPASRAVGE